MSTSEEMGRRPKIASPGRRVTHPLAGRNRELRALQLAPQLAVEGVPISSPLVAETEVAEWSTNEGVNLYGYRAGGYSWITGPGVAAYRFSSDGPVLASPDGSDDSRIEAVWLSSVLPLVVQARGTQVIHASAVAGTSGFVVLCGVSGAGKSTLAAALMQRGHELIADDALPFRLEDDCAVGYPLPVSLRLRRPSAEMLGIEERSDRVAPREPGPISALVILNPDPTDARIAVFEALTPPVPNRAGEVVAELLPHLYCFSLAEGKEQLVRDLFALVRAVRVLRLDYPQRPERLVVTCEVLEGLLAP